MTSKICVVDREAILERLRDDLEINEDFQSYDDSVSSEQVSLQEMSPGFVARSAFVIEAPACPPEASEIWTSEPVARGVNLPGVERIAFLGLPPGSGTGDLSGMNGLEEIRAVESIIILDQEKLPSGLKSLDMYNSFIADIRGVPKVFPLESISMDYDNVRVQDGFGIESRDLDVLEKMVAFPYLTSINVSAGNDPPACILNKKIYGEFGHWSLDKDDIKELNDCFPGIAIGHPSDERFEGFEGFEP